MLNFRILSSFFFIVLFHFQPLYAQSPKYFLAHGNSVVLYPDSHQDNVHINFIVDKMELRSRGVNSCYASLYVSYLQNSFRDLPSILLKGDNRIHSLSVLDWQYAQLFSVQMKAADFQDNLETILRIIHDYSSISRVQEFDSNFILNNLPFMDPSSFSIFDSLTTQANSRQGIRDFSKANILPSVNVYIFGSFNPLDVLLKIQTTGLKKPQNIKPLSSEILVTQHLESGFYRIEFNLGQICQHNLVLRSWLKEQLKLFLAGRIPEEKFLIYDPWLPTDAILTLFVARLNYSPSLLENFSGYLEKNFKTPLFFRNWYYTTYTARMSALMSDPEALNKFRCMSELYLGSMEAFSSIYTTNTFPAALFIEKIQQSMDALSTLQSELMTNMTLSGTDSLQADSPHTDVTNGFQFPVLADYFRENFYSIRNLFAENINHDSIISPLSRTEFFTGRHIANRDTVLYAQMLYRDEIYLEWNKTVYSQLSPAEFILLENATYNYISSKFALKIRSGLEHPLIRLLDMSVPVFYPDLKIVLDEETAGKLLRRLEIIAPLVSSIQNSDILEETRKKLINELETLTTSGSRSAALLKKLGYKTGEFTNIQELLSGLRDLDLELAASKLNQIFLEKKFSIIRLTANKKH